MTVFSLYPSFCVLTYHSNMSPHKQTIPTTQWLPTPNVGGAGAYSQWDSGTIDADTMWEDYAEALAATLPSTITIDDYVIYNYDAPEAQPHPVASGALGNVGTAEGDGVPAAQATLSFRTADFNPFKLVLLDIIPSPDFLPVRFTGLTPAQIALVNLLRSNDYAFAGRDGAQISQFIRATFDLNDKLRRSYRFG